MNPKRYRPFWGTMLSFKKIVSTSNSWLFFSSFIFCVVGEELSIFTILAGTGGGGGRFKFCGLYSFNNFKISCFNFYFHHLYHHLQEYQVHILHRKCGRTAFFFKKMNPKRYRPFLGTMLSSKKINSTSNFFFFSLALLHFV